MKRIDIWIEAATLAVIVSALLLDHQRANAQETPLPRMMQGAPGPTGVPDSLPGAGPTGAMGFPDSCLHSTFEPNRVYQIGDRINTLNTCVIDGDAFYLSLTNDNKGNNPQFSSPYTRDVNWHHSCGLCGPDEVQSLLYEYEKLRGRKHQVKGAVGTETEMTSIIERKSNVWYDHEVNSWRVYATHPKGRSFGKILMPISVSIWCDSQYHAEYLASKHMQMWDEFAANRELENMVS